MRQLLGGSKTTQIIDTCPCVNYLGGLDRKNNGLIGGGGGYELDRGAHEIDGGGYEIDGGGYEMDGGGAM